MKNEINKITKSAPMIIGLLMAGFAFAGETNALFRDGFENCSVGAAPAANDPDIGTYGDIGTVLVRTGSTSGGPTAAKSGLNYLEINRFRSGSLTISALFSGPISTSQRLRTTFWLWYQSGEPNFRLLGGDSHLLYHTVFEDLSYRAFVGTKVGTNYVTLIGAGTILNNAWNKIAIQWDPVEQHATVSVNGAEMAISPPVGSVPATLDRLVFGTSFSNTVWWLDDIIVEPLAK